MDLRSGKCLHIEVLECDSQRIIAMKMQKNRHAYSFSVSMKVVFPQMNLFITTTIMHVNSSTPHLFVITATALYLHTHAYVAPF